MKNGPGIKFNHICIQMLLRADTDLWTSNRHQISCLCYIHMIDKQTMKLCYKLHGTRRAYNLDLIKLILKNTTDIFFSWAVAVGLLSPWETDHFQTLFLLQCVQCGKCFCCAPWLCLICSQRIFLMGWKGKEGCLRHCCILLHTPLLPHNSIKISPVQRAAAYIWDSMLRPRLSEELWGAEAKGENVQHGLIMKKLSNFTLSRGA